ncbi:hypothetical protein [Streptomyces canus]|uniref:hypothetical protein n=1 Tax=Streptomyces canus TaxID=58343 RepID=UPI00225230CA|nr:hypothetical protein [Streptomyces canus]MCX4860878.1 hypothetical protein [Streptomyces canus]
MVHPEFARTGQEATEDDGRPASGAHRRRPVRRLLRAGPDRGSVLARIDASPVRLRYEAGDRGAGERITVGQVPVTPLTRPAGASGADVKSGP